MSDDIVTRLRTKYSGQLPICNEAADEIERLRKLIKDYHSAEYEYSQEFSEGDLVVLKEEWQRSWKAIDEEVKKMEINYEN